MCQFRKEIQLIIDDEVVMAAFDNLIRMLEQRLVRQEAGVAETKAQLEAAKAAVQLAKPK